MQESRSYAYRILNLSSDQPNPPTFSPPRHKIVRDRLKRCDAVMCRVPGTIDGVVIHQTGTPFGVTKAAVKAAGGDEKLAKHRRALSVAAHMTVFNTGVAVLAHPLDWYVYHANTLNARSLGLEIEGLFPREQGPKELFTGTLLEGAKAGLQFLVEEGRSRGMPIRWVWAHRQSSMMRADDPGAEIWKKLVVDFAIPELGLIAAHDFVAGGQRIPDSWCERKK